MDERTPESIPPQEQPEERQQAVPPAPPEAAASPSPPVRVPTPPRQPSAVRRYWWIPTSCAIGCLPWFMLFVIMLGLIAGGGSREPVTKHVALIRVSGVIAGGGSGSDLFGGATAGSEDIINQLERARKNDSAKAIVVRIVSPGGSAAASEEIYNEIMRVRQSGKPVYASMGDVAASGGYYVASACNRINADSSTITGSIGVIFSASDMSELYRKIGYRPQVLKSGKFKDTGSPARPLTAEDRKLIQGIIASIYETFLEAVADGRKTSVEKLKPIADGRMFTGKQALKVGLVDGIGGLRETVVEAARAGGISGEPKVVDYRERRLFDILAGDFAGAASSVREAELRRITEELLRQDHMIRAVR